MLEVKFHKEMRMKILDLTKFIIRASITVSIIILFSEAVSNDTDNPGYNFA